MRVYILSLMALVLGTGVLSPGLISGVLARTETKAVTAGPLPPRPLVPSGSGEWLWQNPLPQGNKLNDISCAIDGGAVCYAVGDYGTVVRSSDGGATWQAVLTHVSNNLNGVSCFDSSTCVAVGLAGTILVSSSGGNTWRAVSAASVTDLNAVSCIYGTPVCLAVGNSGKVIKTVDQGTTWNAVSFPYGDPLRAISCFKVASYKCLVGGGRFIGEPGGTSSRVVSTPDGGSTWVNETTGLSTSQRVNDVTCFSESGNYSCYAVGDFGGIAYTPNLTNSGSSWNLQSLPSGFISSGLGGVSCTGSPGITRCFISAGSSPGQLFSKTGGGAWLAVTTGLTINSSHNDLICTYLSGPVVTRCLVVSDFGRIIATNDSGASWSDRTGGILNATIYSLSCPNTTTCFAAGSLANGSLTSSSVLGTTDRGHTWDILPLPGGSFEAPLTAISCINSSPVSCVATGTSFNSASSKLTNRVYVTTNGGASWSYQDLANGPLKGVSCVNGTPSFSCVIVGGSIFGGIYAGSAPTVIYRSTDSGGTWNLQTPPAGFDDELYGVSCPSDTTCYAAGGNYTSGRLRVIGTTNGTTWTNKLNRTDVPDNVFSGINCPNTATCYAVGGTVNSLTGGRIEITSDSGANWQVQSIPVSPFLNAVSCISPLSCFVTGNSGTILTTNEGGPWTAMASSTTINLYTMSCTVVICLTGGAGGGILESPLLVTIAGDTDSLTNPGTLSYALTTASGYQSIYGYVPGNKVVLSGSNPLPHLQSGVRFVGGSCTAKLTIAGKRTKTGLILDGGNLLVGLRLLEVTGPGIATAGPGNRLSCVQVQL